MAQRIFKSSFIERISDRLRKGDAGLIDAISKGTFQHEASQSLVVEDYPDLSEISLADPEGTSDLSQSPNAVKLYEFLKISPFQASDPRLWSYLALVTFRDYMLKKRKVKDSTRNKADYILTHYICPGSSIRNLLLHDIALLWWVPYLTVLDDPQRKYRLSEEVFSHLDFTRHLLQGTQGRALSVRHAVLEFVVDNPQLFKGSKEARIRLIMRRLNTEAGYRLFPIVSKDDVKAAIEELKPEIELCHK